MRLDGYIRVSRIGGRSGEGYISPDVQREAIERYAAELGGEIVHWHDDQDYSGGNIERPGFQAMLDRLRDRQTDGAIVMAIDRFARSVKDGATVIAEIRERDQVFASCQERIDLRTDEGHFMLNTFLNNAELFLNQARTRFAMSKARAIARGAHVGPTPIGYQRIPTGGERSGCLIPHPLYGPAITELFERAASGQHGDTDLARWMTERAPREGGRGWQPSEVRRWLGNRVYRGEVRNGDLINTEAHEPLVDEATFERAQREPGSPRVRAGSPFLLGGLARCANCRYAMTGQSHGGANRATPVYRCNAGRECDARSVVVASHLEDHVTELLADKLRTLRLEAAENGTDLENSDREYEQAESDVQTYGADFEARRMLGEAAWRENLAQLAAIRDAKRAARAEAYARAQLTEAGEVDLDSLDRDGLRDALTAAIRVIFIRRRPRGAAIADRVRVIWSDDPGTLDLPGPHRGGPFEPVEW